MNMEKQLARCKEKIRVLCKDIFDKCLTGNKYECSVEAAISLFERNKEIDEQYTEYATALRRSLCLMSAIESHIKKCDKDPQEIFRSLDIHIYDNIVDWSALEQVYLAIAAANSLIAHNCSTINKLMHIMYLEVAKHLLDSLKNYCLDYLDLLEEKACQEEIVINKKKNGKKFGNTKKRRTFAPS